MPRKMYDDPPESIGMRGPDRAYNVCLFRGRRGRFVLAFTGDDGWDYMIHLPHGILRELLRDQQRYFRRRFLRRLRHRRSA